jgi:cell division protease FtsH
MTRSEMIGRLVFAMGGRSAEELVFHEPTTGASSDIDQATKIARAMVTEYGMSARLGAVRYGREQGDPFLGRSMGNQADYSLEVAHEIDEEVRKLIEAAHTEAWEILNTYRDVLDELVFELLEKETLTRRDLERIFGSVQKRPRITAFNDFGGRTPSDKPPIQTPAERARERGEPWPPHVEPEREPTPVGSFPGGANGVPAPGPNGGPVPPIPVPPGGYPGGGPGQFPATQPQTWATPQPQQPPNAVPHNYGAPPDWRPATTPGGQSWPPPGQHWQQPGPTWNQPEHGPGNGHVDGHVDDHARPHPGATPPAVPPVPDAAPPARPADPTVEPPTGNGSHPREDGSR